MKEVIDKSFLKQADISNTQQDKQENHSKSELNRIKVFKHIESTEPTTIYRVHKELEMAYTTISYIVRDLIFAGVVSERVEINENNVATKILTIPKDEAKDGE